MAGTGQIQNAIKEMERWDLKMLGISKMRCLDANYCDIEEYRISGASNKYENEVRIIMHKLIAQTVPNFVPVNERAMLVPVKAIPMNVNIVQVQVNVKKKK